MPIERKNYAIYELIDNISGCAVYRDPYGALRHTLNFFLQYPHLTDYVERLWFNSFLPPESEALIFKILRSCRHLTNISVPWLMLRHGSGQDWLHLLGIANEHDVPVQSLELQAICLPGMLTNSPEMAFDRQPLLDPRVSFANLRRLKLIGNPKFMPIPAADLRLVAQPAHSLEEFHLPCLSTETIAGVMAVVKASQQTLRVLDHSPRSNDGFFHPDPGCLDDGDHACAILAACPRLTDLSISIPGMCAALFANHDVQWRGGMQVRALTLCPGASPPKHGMRALLGAARDLAAARQRQRSTLDVELFFADCIFAPAVGKVHGDFELASICSRGLWPRLAEPSGKGPYGSTGLYGKEEGDWQRIDESEWLRGIEAGYLRI